MRSPIDYTKLETPSLSVICPVYNSKSYLEKLIQSLRAQTYGASSYELIIVDNGSTDGSYEGLLDYAGITVLRRTDVASSYAARNAGIKAASGEILAFIDADCLPETDWLLNGVRCFQDTNADMVAGKVKFSVHRKSSGFRVFDAITHIDAMRYVVNGRAPTANLFVKRPLFDRVGEFPEHLRSGGDVLWTTDAVADGARLVYCDQARVWHPTRGPSESLLKAIRVGTGFADRTVFMGRTLPRSLVSLLYVVQGTIPPVGVTLYRRFRDKCPDFGAAVFLRVYFAAYVTRMAQALGVFVKWTGLFRKWVR